MGTLLWGSIMRDMDNPGDLVVTSRSLRTLSTTAVTSSNLSVVSYINDYFIIKFIGSRSVENSF